VLRAEGVRAGLHNHVGTWVETEHEIDRVLGALDPRCSDRRRVLVFLSDHGKAEHARLAPAVAAVGESLAIELGTEAGLLAELLERVRRPLTGAAP
jgi:hypothetical protein